MPDDTSLARLLAQQAGIPTSAAQQLADRLIHTGVDGRINDASKTALRNSGISRLLTKMSSTIARAEGNNPQVLAPWSAAPTWAINTVYGAGQVVRGTGADASNLYLMAGNNTTVNAEGTSAAAGGGPSGIGAALITDNTCRWLYVGKATAVDTVTPFLSTASLTTSTDEMNGYFQNITTATASAIGLSGYRPVNVTGTFGTEAYFTGGLFNSRGAEQVNGGNSGTAASPSYPASKQRGSLKFVTNARKWIGLNSQNSVILKNSSYDIIVNGRRLSETPLVYGADNSGRVHLFNLSKFPEGLKTIEVRVSDSIQSRIAFEVHAAEGDFVMPFENPNRWRMAFEGDSITQGTYIAAFKPQYWIERIVGDHLGCDAVYNNAEIGTGLINSYSKTVYMDRMQDLVAFAPDVVVLGGCHNDSGNDATYNSTTRRAAALAYFQALRSSLPNAIVVVIGAQLLQGEVLTAGATTQQQVEVDIKAAFDTWGDPNSTFIPLLTDPKQRVTSANGRFYFASGPAPYTDTHPIPGYYPYIGGLIAEKIKKFVLSSAG